MIDTIRWRLFFSTRMLVTASALFCAPFLHGQAESSTSKPDSSQNQDVSPDVPKYDVATIKPAQGSDMRVAFMFTPDGISLSGVQLQMMLREAFDVEDDHIVGAPGWVKTTRYDVQAKVAPENAPKLEKLKMDERRSMLLPLLVERFNLKYHHEMRELPSYSLVVAKGGPKMKLSEIQDSAAPKPGDPGANPKPGDPAPSAGPPRRMLRMMGRGQVEAEGSNTQMLARVLSQQLGRTVVDKTGLTSNYDYKLSWTPDDAPPLMGGGEGGPPHNDNGSDAAGPSLFTAVQEQLGLKLESGKGTVDVIVIDHIDLPSEN